MNPFPSDGLTLEELVDHIEARIQRGELSRMSMIGQEQLNKLIREAAAEKISGRSLVNGYRFCPDDDDVDLSISEQVAMNAGFCLAWRCEQKAGEDGYCEAHRKKGGAA